MIYFYRAQATSGRLSQDLIALKEEVRNVKALVTSQPCGAPSAGKTSASAIAVEKPEVPPKVHRFFSSGVQTRILSDPTQQVIGQNKKENIRHIASLQNRLSKVFLRQERSCRILCLLIRRTRVWKITDQKTE